MSKAPSQSHWEHIMAAARAGDHGSLGELLQKFWPALWRTASRSIDGRLAAKHSPSDAVQETFCDAQRSIGDFRGTTPAEFHAWLKAILARNLADARRRFIETQKRDAYLERPLDPGMPHDELLASGASSPSAAMRDHELRQQIEQAMMLLSPAHAEILRLRYWEHRTFVEIGELLGKSPDAIRMSWYRAIEQFSKIIDDRQA